MTDRYIDQDETQIYGPYASKKIRTRVIGLVPVFDKGLAHLAAEIDRATTAVAAAVAGARGTDADLRKGVKGKSAALKAAIAVLGRFSKHLDSHADGAVDRKVFFPGDGTAGGLGRSAPRVLQGLNHVASELAKKGGQGVEEKARWVEEVTRAAAALSPDLERSDNARTDRRVLTPEVEEARLAWLKIYKAARAGVECVLRLTDKTDLLPVIFHDLAVPADAKITAAPADPPPAPTTATASPPKPVAISALPPA